MLGDSTRFSSQQTWSRLRTQLRAARGAALSCAAAAAARRSWRRQRARRSRRLIQHRRCRRGEAWRRLCTGLGQRVVVVQGKGCDVPSSSSVSRLCPQAHYCTLWSKAWGLIIFFVPVFYCFFCSFAFFLLQTL